MRHDHVYPLAVAEIAAVFGLSTYHLHAPSRRRSGCHHTNTFSINGGLRGKSVSRRPIVDRRSRPFGRIFKPESFYHCDEETPGCDPIAARPGGVVIDLHD